MRINESEETVTIYAPRWCETLFALMSTSFPGAEIGEHLEQSLVTVLSVLVGICLAVVVWKQPRHHRAVLTSTHCLVYDQNNRLVFDETWSTIDRVERGLQLEGEEVITKIVGQSGEGDISRLFNVKFEEFAYRRNPKIKVIRGWEGP